MALLALVVLAAYSILAILALRAGTDDVATILWVMAAILGLTLLVFTIIIIFRPEVAFTGLHAASDDANESSVAVTAGLDWDVFVSSPMSSFADEQSYADHRLGLMQILTALRKDCGFNKIYCASERFEYFEDFEAKNIAFDKDSRALRNSSRFLMIYPAALSSSVLVEAGMAIALYKTSVFWVNKSAKLPFMLEQAGQVQGSRVTVYEYTDLSEIVRHFKINGGAAFDQN